MIKNIFFALSCFLISSSVFADQIRHKTCAVHTDENVLEFLGDATWEILNDKGYRVIMANDDARIHVGRIYLYFGKSTLMISEIQIGLDGHDTKYYLTRKSISENFKNLEAAEQASILQGLIPNCSIHDLDFADYYQ